MSWLDIVLVVVLAALTALGMQRRLSGLLIGAGAVVLLRPLLLFVAVSPMVAVILAGLAGLALSYLGRRIYQQTRGKQLLTQIAGGFGGFVLGLSLVLAVVTSLPIQRNPINPNEIFYPPRDLPRPINQAVSSSQLVLVGRSILLYPLLESQNEFEGGEDDVFRGLHNYLIVGQPWRRR